MERDLAPIELAVFVWQHHNGDDSLENVLNDMLTDMMHMADKQGVYLDVDRAEMHYSAEAGICDDCGITPQEVFARDKDSLVHTEHNFVPDDIELDRRSR